MPPKKPLHWFHNGKHPMWLVIRQLVVMLPLCLLLAFGYANGWSANDWKTLIVPLASLGIFDVVKKMITNSNNNNNSDENA